MGNVRIAIFQVHTILKSDLPAGDANDTFTMLSAQAQTLSVNYSKLG